MYALIENGKIAKYPYSLGEYRRDNPQVSLPSAPTEETLESIGLAIVVETEQPTYNEATQAVEELTPIKQNGAWVQKWAVRALTEAELKDRVPKEVTMRQARLALLGAGKLAGVDAAIASMPEPQRTAASIEWEYSNALQRNNQFVAQLGAALGIDAAGIDALFIAAAKL